jgi:hypothetical protein
MSGREASALAELLNNYFHEGKGENKLNTSKKRHGKKLRTERKKSTQLQD